MRCSAGRILKEDIRTILEDSDQILVRSRWDILTVDMNIGTCTCVTGRDESPDSHQPAVAINFQTFSLNCIPTFDILCADNLYI